jgi:hypothetical protein
LKNLKIYTNALLASFQDQNHLLMLQLANEPNFSRHTENEEN